MPLESPTIWGKKKGWKYTGKGKAEKADFKKWKKKKKSIKWFNIIVLLAKCEKCEKMYIWSTTSIKMLESTQMTIIGD